MFGRAFPDGCPVRANARRLRLRHASQSYVAHGWPVAVGAKLCGDRFSCGPGCRTVSCHPAPCQPDPAPPLALTNASEVDVRWRESPYSVLLPTGERFDVVDVPAHIGVLARDVLVGPVAVTPIGRWMFFVQPGAPLRPELAALSDVVLHGRGSWVPAPPVRSPNGHVRWVKSPREAQWRLPTAERVQAALTATLSGHTVASVEHRRAA